MRDIAKQMRLQEYASQVEDWKQSGLTQRQWCKVHGITLECFKYRKRTVEDQAEELLSSFMSSIPPAAQIVKLPDPEELAQDHLITAHSSAGSCTGTIKIEMPEGNILAPGNIDPEVLQMVIREVKNA